MAGRHDTRGERPDRPAGTSGGCGVRAGGGAGGVSGWTAVVGGASHRRGWVAAGVGGLGRSHRAHRVGVSAGREPGTAGRRGLRGGHRAWAAAWARLAALGAAAADTDPALYRRLRLDPGLRARRADRQDRGPLVARPVWGRWRVGAAGGACGAVDLLGCGWRPGGAKR